VRECLIGRICRCFFHIQAGNDGFEVMLRPIPFLIVAILSSHLVACSTAPLQSLMKFGSLDTTLVARAPTDGETKTPDDADLSGVAELPAGQEVERDGKTLLAGPIYHAASGKQCRTVMFTTDTGASYCRLACKSGSRWAWARSF